jgi:serine/threonine protein kinase/WD40 repeat protein
MTSDSWKLLDFLDRFDADRAAGRELPLSHYLRQFPDDEAAVAREYLMRAGAAPADDEVTPPEPNGDQVGRIGPFRLLRELGRGGQGSVYLAEDSRVRRLVALKVLAPSAIGSETARRRFRHEAEAIARLDHASLCGIHEANLEGDTPYLAMRYVAGETLRERLRRARAAVPPAVPGARELPELLRLFERLARALHAAHEAGIVHRDVKPGNILLASDGMPVLVDFGVARLERADGEPRTLTAPGQSFGTPGYMAPEQLRRERAVDRRIDVFALGVVLWECLTLVSPAACAPGFGDAGAAAIDVQRDGGSVPTDLRVVVGVATASEPGHRYATALAFAEDLRRVREYEPILARPASAWLQLRRWLRRRRRALLVGGAAAALTVAASTSWILRELSDRVHAARQEVLQARTTARQQPQLALGSALQAWTRSPDDYVNTLAIEALGHDHQLWESYGHRPEQRSSFLRPTVAVSGALVCACLERTIVEVRDGSRGVLLASLRDATGFVAVTAGPDESFFVASAAGTVHRWSRADGFTAWRAGVSALVGHHVLSVQCVPGAGARRLVLTRDGLVVATDAEGARQEFVESLSPPDGQEAHAIAACSHDGTTIAVAFGRPLDAAGALFPDNPRILVRATAPDAVAWNAPGRSSRVNDLQFAPDGRTLAIGYEDGAFELIDLDARAIVATRQWRGEVFCVRFHPDGRHVVVALAGGRRQLDPRLVDAPIRVLDRATGEEVLAVGGHEQRGAMAIDFSPDGRWFASAGNDRRIVVRRADALAEPPLRTLGTCCSRAVALRWFDDARRVVAFDGLTVACWDTQQPAIVSLAHGEPVGCARLSPDSRVVVTGTMAGAVRAWRRESGDIERDLGTVAGPVIDLRFAAAGRLLAVQQPGPELVVFDVASWTRHGIEFASAVTCWAVDERTPRAIVGLEDGDVMLVDLATGTTRRADRGPEAEPDPHAIDCAAMSPDGGTVWTGARGRILELWDVDSARRLRRLQLPPSTDPRAHAELDRVLALCALADGRWLVSTQEPAVWTFDPAAPTPFAAVHVEPITVQSSLLDSHPRGDLLVIGADVGGATMLRWPELTIVDPRTASSGMLSALQFSRTGRFLLTANYGGSARLLRCDGEPRYWSLLIGHGGPVLSADISDDEKWVVTASADGTVRVWPTEPIDFCATTGRRGRVSDGAFDWRR